MVDAATCGRAVDAMLHGEEETDMSKRGVTKCTADGQLSNPPVNLTLGGFVPPQPSSNKTPPKQRAFVRFWGQFG